jgi:hypothetical protein
MPDDFLTSSRVRESSASGIGPLPGEDEFEFTDMAGPDPAIPVLIP